MKSRSCSAFTLFEALIGLLIFSTVSASCIGTFITLQRGFLFMNTWSDVRNAQVLVLDSVSQDLRDATQVSGTNSSVPISITGTGSAVSTLTFVVPQFYSDYFTGTSYDTPPVARAGTPLVTASTNFLYVPLTSGSTIQTGTIVYSGTAIGTTGRIDVVRKFFWTGASGGKSATRAVASFPNGVKLQYALMVSGSAIASGSSTNASAVRILITGTAGYRRPTSTGLTQDTIFLRAYSTGK